MNAAADWYAEQNPSVAAKWFNGLIHRKDSGFHGQSARHDFLNGQGCLSEGSTDVLSSYLRYAGGLTCPVDMKGYLE